MITINSANVTNDDIKKPKKITGTRFGAVLGLNEYTTPFSAWCEITHTYEQPPIDNIYVNAGKVIEPKQAEYVKRMYFIPNLTSPKDVFGDNPYETTHGDFFPNNNFFGGMWDYIELNSDGSCKTLFEMKTTKLKDKWQGDDIPVYYALQASLYGYLLGCDDVCMCVSFLDDKDYILPQNYFCTANNTKLVRFKISEKFPNFKDLIANAEQWYTDCVLGGISPPFDREKDKDILRELTTTSFHIDGDLTDVCAECERLQAHIDEVTSSVQADMKKLDKLKKLIKLQLQEQMTDKDSRVVAKYGSTDYTLTKSITSQVDVEKLKQDGLYEKYTQDKETFRFTIKKEK